MIIDKLKREWQLLLFVLCVLLFFSPFLILGKIPIPSDTIVGMYHPFRDVVWDDLVSGVPFKNFLITDAVRQQYPWRKFGIESLVNFQIPLWNPFNFSGTPLLANLQSAVLNPLNFLLIILPFPFGWGVQVLLQVLLAGIFLYFWLRNYRLDKFACLLGSLSFSFGGFFTAWLEWNTVLFTALYLPLILFAIDKIIEKLRFCIKKEQWYFSKNVYIWSIILIIAATSSFFSGHLQTFYYAVSLSLLYFSIKLFFLIKEGRNIRPFILVFLVNALCVFLISAIQLFPAVEFILNSARSFDQPGGFRLDWYLPWEHLTQLFAPDIFGNPSTLNYFGKWNYGEFVSYIGAIPIFFAVTAIIGRRDKKTWFFLFIAIIAFVFALPNILSFLPYRINLPFISTTAPSRLVFLADFSLSVLAVLGFDYLLKEKKYKKIIISSLIFIIIYVVLWFAVLSRYLVLDEINILIAKRNLYLPTALVAFGIIMSFMLVTANRAKAKNIKFINIIKFIIIIFIIFLSAFDLVRFSQKFNPFVKVDWIFPTTKTIDFLKKQKTPFRIASLDSRILPPNFSLAYRLETVEGYDPLYDLYYGEFWAAVKRNKPDITPFNFNRIITPQIASSPFIDMLNVKYLLSLSDISDPKLQLVFTEGQTKVYQNLKVFPRVFEVGNIIVTKNKKDSMEKLFRYQDNLKDLAIVEQGEKKINLNNRSHITSSINIIKYEPQNIIINSSGTKDRLMVLGNIYYPGWKVKIDGQKSPIYRTDYLLQGVFVPEGEHTIEFYYLPTSFFIGMATSILGVIIIFLWGVSVWVQKK